MNTPSQYTGKMNKIQKGFISGIALSLLVAVGIFSAVHSTSAQGEEQSTNASAFTADTGATTAAPVTASADATIVAPTVAAPAVTTPTPLARTTAYVGLGDSVAAGLGLPTWTTATAQDKTCGRSPYSYVFEVGRQLKRPHAPYACSGATADNMNGQLDQAFAQGVPAVISITAGANDLGWNKIIQSCYTGNCDSANINQKLEDAQTHLLGLMQQIQTRSGNTPPKVILTGYYNPISAQCTAATGGKLSAYEIQWITAGVTALNTTIKNVATTYGTFATYAPVNFAGHDICSATPWVQGLTDVAPLHPNAAGQNAIAASVVAVARPSIL